MMPSSLPLVTWTSSTQRRDTQQIYTVVDLALEWKCIHSAAHSCTILCHTLPERHVSWTPCTRGVSRRRSTSSCSRH